MTLMHTAKPWIAPAHKQVLWGGTRDGVPVGGARYYMGERFYGR